MDQDIEIVGAEDMVLDMDNFDFSMIDQEEAPEEEVVVEEAAEEVAEEVAEEEEAEEAEEEEAVEEEEEVEIAEGEEEEVDYDNYEINLPSGEAVKLSELVQGYKSTKEAMELKEEVDRIKQEFEEKSGGLVRHLELAKLEADRVIEDYKDFDWATLAKEDPQAYVENREFLDKYRERRREIIQSMEDLNAREQEEKNRITQEKAREANATLARDLKGWGPDMYKALCTFAVESKLYDQDTILNCTDAATFKLLHKAMEHEKGVQTVKAKVKRIGAPKKVVKAAPAKPSVSEAAKKQALLKKAEAAGDMTAMFHLLED